MPTKKDTKKEKDKKLRRFAEQYQISFEGPVQPKKWPLREQDLFHVIREIWANRYDNYTERSDIDQKTMRKQKDRVRRLCQIARRLRQDDINEDTWRILVETALMERFSEEIIWFV
jgi:hypothetical protein